MLQVSCKEHCKPCKNEFVSRRDREENADNHHSYRRESVSCSIFKYRNSPMIFNPLWSRLCQCFWLEGT